jgi:ACR3 family arsenite efflux pump ArsB
MIVPMLIKIDFAALGQVKEHWRGIGVTLSAITVPWDTLVLSVVLYIVVPVIFAQLLRRRLFATGGEPA